MSRRILLREAIGARDWARVRALLGGGVDSFVSDGPGLAFLFREVLAHDPPVDVVELLCEAGADPDPATEEVPRPIHVASAAGALRSLEWLLVRGAQVDAPGPDGQTPLLFGIARFGGREERLLAVVEALLAAGADPSAADRDGRRAADRARARRFFDVLVRLDPGAEPDHEYADIDSVLLRNDEAHHVVFRPNDVVDTFVIGCGHWHGRMYGTSSARRALEQDREIFEAARLGWFLPLLERLVTEGRIPLAELRRAHRSNEGRPLEQSPSPPARPERAPRPVARHDGEGGDDP